MTIIRIAARVAFGKQTDQNETLQIVEVWRGMTGLTSEEVAKIIGHTPEESGIIALDSEVPVSQMNWWTTRRGAAIIYAVTDPVQGPKGPKEIRYDILLRGEVSVPEQESDSSTEKEVTHLLRRNSISIMMREAYYAVRGTDTKKRRSVLESLLNKNVSRAASEANPLTAPLTQIISRVKIREIDMDEAIDLIIQCFAEHGLKFTKTPTSKKTERLLWTALSKPDELDVNQIVSKLTRSWLKSLFS